MTEQRDRAWLDAAKPAEIADAYKAGELATLLGGTAPADVPAEGQLTGEHTAQMSPKQITDALKAGRLDTLLGRQASAPAAPGTPPPAPADPAPAAAPGAAPAAGAVYVPPEHLAAMVRAWAQANPS